jgi:hypothetical protein
MTYRERREARAARLREWAEKRKQRADAALKSHEHYRGDYAFNTQPGHIPERARVIKQEDRAFESLRKADSMDARARSIEAATDHAIYSDDTDAAARLRERIAELEAKRERYKAFNKRRKPEERDDPPLSTTSLSAAIRHDRQRLAALTEATS